MNEPSLSESNNIRKRWGNFRARVQKVLPFLSGVLAALLALLIYDALTPGTQVTQTDVDNTVARALASATPRPPFSVQVYQIIQPSLVLIETESADADANGEADHGLGSGVIINEEGNILTALHVVDGATKISLIFADGTHAEGTIAASQPENDIAMLTPSALPETWAPATIGNAGAMRVGDDAYVVGNPFGLYNSMSAGVISGFDRAFQPPNTNKMIRGLIQVDAAVNPGNS